MVLKCPTGNLFGLEAACRVAMVYGINIAECDKAKTRVTMSNRLRSAKAIAGFVADITSEPIDVVATANIGHEASAAKRRRAGVASVVAKKSVNEDGVYTLPSSKLQKPFKGAISHLEYQEILKV